MRRALLPLALLVACGPATPSTRSPAPKPKPAPAADPAVAAPDPAAPTFRLPAGVRPAAYDVALELDADKETFAGHIEITLDLDQPAPHVWLDTENLSISSAIARTAGGEVALRTLTTSTDARLGLAAPAPLVDGDVLVIDYKGQVATRQFQGLFRQQDGGRWHLFSQFEATAARRAFPCFDEPSFKVPWKMAITSPAGQRAYANGAQIAEETGADGRITRRFAETPPIPSYLVAVAVGPFEEVDAGKVGRNQLPARILTPAGRAAEAGEAAKQMPRIVAWLEDYFDMPLPFDKVDSIAIPSFFGAMENPGLITYGSGILLSEADKVDEEFRTRLIAIAGHELAHQWFGNYVTPAWWDDIWLNESFATWMAGKAVAALESSFDPVVERVEAASRAMYADSSRNAGPLHRPINSPADIEGSFDAISYDKGGAVLTMFEHWIGEEAFRDGVRGYMQAHARANATAEDFIAALTGASSPELATSFRSYLEQAGVPMVSVQLDCPGRNVKPTVTLRQERMLGFGETGGGELWPVRACVRYGTGKGKQSTDVCVDLAGAEAQINLAADCPAWLVGNADGAGYYRTSYDDALRGRIGKHLRKLPKSDRVAFAADQVALLGAGRLAADDALAVVGALLASGDGRDRSGAVELLGATEAMVDDDLLPAWRAWVVEQVGKAARKQPLLPPAKESRTAGEQRADLVELVGLRARDARLAAAARKKVDAWLADPKAAPPRGLGLPLSIAARSGDAALFDKLLDRARATEDPRDRSVVIGGLGHFVDPALMVKAQELLMSGEIDLMQGGELLQAQLSSAEGAKSVAAFLRDKWDGLVQMLPKLALPYLVQMQGAVCDQASRDEVDAFMATRIDEIPNGAAVLAQTLGGVDACIARKAAVRAELQAILKKK